jgi:exopolyphosphatase / guanosine-5'-triphosphate,3'-diphosphate pyrophosphatase
MLPDYDSSSCSRYAVIDIGSNSVRLVIFDRYRRDPVPLYNEKVSCKLGHLTQDQYLREDSKQSALMALRRFGMILAPLSAEHIHAVATAGLRDAKDGKDFLPLLCEALGHPIHIITGEEEAELAAYGILCGIPKAEGFSGDLGGGSLELTPLKEGSLLETGVSVPLGILRLEEKFPYATDPLWSEKAEPYITQLLRTKASFLKTYGQGQTFYTIGGSWRAFGTFCMGLYGYPLHILHGYTLSIEEALYACDILIQQAGAPRIGAFQDVPKKRWDELPYAALLLKRILKEGLFSHVMISATGLREGLVYKTLPSMVQQQDPLLSALEGQARSSARCPELSSVLYWWTDSLFSEDSFALKRLREAICLASDIGWQYHPDYRSKVVPIQILYGPWYDLSHEERILMAVAVGYRYDTKFSPDTLVEMNYFKNQEGTAEAKKSLLISSQQIEWAMQLGLCLRLGYRVCGGSVALLNLTKLSMTKDALIFSIDPIVAHDMPADSVEKRFQKVAAAFHKKGRMIAQ